MEKKSKKKMQLIPAKAWKATKTLLHARVRVLSWLWKLVIVRWKMWLQMTATGRESSVTLAKCRRIPQRARRSSSVWPKKRQNGLGNDTNVVHSHWRSFAVLEYRILVDGWWTLKGIQEEDMIVDCAGTSLSLSASVFIFYAHVPLIKPNNTI